MCVVVVCAGGRVVRSEERYRLTLQYILTDGVEVRLVNGQDKGMDAIATVRCLYSITVDTCCREVLTLIEVTAALTDRNTCGVEGLLVDAELEAEEPFLAVDGGIVAVGTCSVVCFLVIAPAVVPDERQVVLTDGDDGIDQRMNNQLKHRGAVAAFRRMCVVVVCAGGRVGLSEEVYRLSLQYILADRIIIRCIYGEDERFDAVASVRCSQGITIETRFGKIHALEAITASLADRYTCGIQYRIVNYELETVVHLLALIVGGIVAIDTGRVERSDGTIPLVDPHVRQLR